MSTTATAPTQTEAALEQFRKAGVPIERARRPYRSKKMEGFNAEVYSAWIERWANNAAANYPIARNSAGVSFLRNAAKDIPAVVIGIGPSLDDEILSLKIAPRHAVIIATDAALRPLLRHGIRPDIVVNYDARDEQSSMWESIDTRGIVLLANSVTSPFTVDAWKGKVMFFNMLQNDDEFASNILPALFPFLGQLPNLGTVGNGAVFLAWQMGCKPILTVGMDLCYKEQFTEIKPAEGDVPATFKIDGWKYRCRDWKLLNENVWAEIENKILYNNEERLAETVDEIIKGKTYKVDHCLKFYRNSLFSNIGQFDMPVINCSGGVFTDQIKTMRLKDAIEEKCYAALEPGRTVVKHLDALIPDGKSDFYLDEKERIFFKKPTVDNCDRTQER